MHTLRAMSADDYDALVDLLRRTPGVTFRDADSREATARYLARNPGLSFLAYCDGQLAGCVMSGHDGRRGYLQHLAVLPAFRRQGIANALVERCLSGLEQLGIQKCHIDVLRSNASGTAYWESQGWQLRTDIHRYSLSRQGGANA